MVWKQRRLFAVPYTKNAPLSYSVYQLSNLEKSEQQKILEIDIYDVDQYPSKRIAWNDTGKSMRAIKPGSKEPPMTRFESKYLIYAIPAYVILIVASVAGRRLAVWTAVYPFIIAHWPWGLFRQFRKVYVQEKPTSAMNAIQLLYLLVFAYAAFLSFMVILTLIG